MFLAQTSHAATKALTSELMPGHQKRRRMNSSVLPGPRMAGKTRSVSPLEDLGSEGGWNEEAVWGSTPRIRFVLLGLDDLCLELPGDSA